MSESKLIPAYGGFRCADCWYFRMEKTVSDVTPTVPYCGNRERMVGWNPLLFMCGNYAAKDEPRIIQTGIDWKWGSRA